MSCLLAANCTAAKWGHKAIEKCVTCILGILNYTSKWNNRSNSSSSSSSSNSSSNSCKLKLSALLCLD
ncbi:GH14896 [Drosophila grimshawi]|uniref:GH14896 n=1 Tax=Drosophila grimshawi TaxID=7222 RepID=B4J277_DROGR|nr:GH14896 [Drosophila grimshawi]